MAFELLQLIIKVLQNGINNLLSMIQSSIILSMIKQLCDLS